MTIPLDVLLISGPSDVGKSTVAFELSRILERHGVSYALIEGDALDFAWPAPEGDPDKSRLTQTNLAAMGGNYRSLGYKRLILTGVYLTNPAARRDTHDALPDATFTTVLLQADDSTRVSRLRTREIGTGLDDHVASTRRAAKALQDPIRDDVHIVETGGRSVGEVATDVAAITGWVPGLQHRLLHQQ